VISGFCVSRKTGQNQYRPQFAYTFQNALQPLETATDGKTEIRTPMRGNALGTAALKGLMNLAVGVNHSPGRLKSDAAK
jgi:hypothetical protein